MDGLLGWLRRGWAPAQNCSVGSVWAAVAACGSGGRLAWWAAYWLTWLGSCVCHVAGCVWSRPAASRRPCTGGGPSRVRGGGQVAVAAGWYGWGGLGRPRRVWARWVGEVWGRRTLCGLLRAWGLPQCSCGGVCCCRRPGAPVQASAAPSSPRCWPPRRLPSWVFPVVWLSVLGPAGGVWTLALSRPKRPVKQVPQSSRVGTLSCRRRSVAAVSYALCSLSRDCCNRDPFLQGTHVNVGCNDSVIGQACPAHRAAFLTMVVCIRSRPLMGWVHTGVWSASRKL